MGQVIEPDDVGWYVDVIGQPCLRCNDVDQTEQGKCLTCSAGVAYATARGFSIKDRRRSAPQKEE